jgi:hypothetical protein
VNTTSNAMFGPARTAKINQFRSPLRDRRRGRASGVLRDPAAGLRVAGGAVAVAMFGERSFVVGARSP